MVPDQEVRTVVAQWTAPAQKPRMAAVRWMAPALEPRTAANTVQCTLTVR